MIWIGLGLGYKQAFIIYLLIKSQDGTDSPIFTLLSLFSLLTQFLLENCKVKFKVTKSHPWLMLAQEYLKHSLHKTFKFSFFWMFCVIFQTVFCDTQNNEFCQCLYKKIPFFFFDLFMLDRVNQNPISCLMKH